ncbi:hypothetical protein DCS_03332 [Drechmeria coniospora]|uniref:Uncharacterized protein n=1 Tax=Drechmeria coniospora TaxID=98403 RepID=A0A151GGX5_DRECN|nr:hypothetical protein DCS_03332 [Drechmeria coniospora]KYK56334.1 hypothetical protein DCS_03332 [Drechmeria coniospora]
MAKLVLARAIRGHQTRSIDGSDGSAVESSEQEATQPSWSLEAGPCMGDSKVSIPQHRWQLKSSAIGTMAKLILARAIRRHQARNALMAIPSSLSSNRQHGQAGPWKLVLAWATRRYPTRNRWQYRRVFRAIGNMAKPVLARAIR